MAPPASAEAPASPLWPLPLVDAAGGHGKEWTAKTIPSPFEETPSWRKGADRSQLSVSGRIESWRKESERQEWREESHRSGGAHHRGGGATFSSNDPWTGWVKRNAQPTWAPWHMATVEGVRNDAEGRQDAWSQHATIPQAPSRRPGSGVAVAAPPINSSRLSGLQVRIRWNPPWPQRNHQPGLRHFIYASKESSGCV